MHVKKIQYKRQRRINSPKTRKPVPCFEEGLEHARNESSRTKRTRTPGINAQGKKGSKTIEELKSNEHSEKKGMSEFLLFHALLAR
jgi:hypothetical protein